MRRLLGSRGCLLLRRHAIAAWRQVRAQDELALEPARLEAAMSFGDLEEIRSATRGRIVPAASRPNSCSKSSLNHVGH
jgi:hypothetical protein